jgi:hypothetical protein
LAESLFTPATSLPLMERPEANLAHIRQQLAETQHTFDTLKMRPRESLRDFEYRVKWHSDNLLSLKVAEQVQQQQIDQEAREAEEELKKRLLDIRAEVSLSHSRLAFRQHFVSRRKRSSHRLTFFRKE